MPYSDYSEDYYSEERFREIYSVIRDALVVGVSSDSENEKCTIILGGQPGAGKSTFYSIRDDLFDYIPINGDEYRRFHPNYQQIIKTDPEHYAERTQSFSNRVVETLISDLGSKGYNLIVEGTLRNPDVPINTCEFLQGKGYKPELVVVACDAEIAWKSTLSRASLLREQGYAPRLVPIDIYDHTVRQIPSSLDKIEQRKCFSKISIINREGETLFQTGDSGKASDILRNELHLDDWEKKLPEYEKDFIEKKIEILQSSLSHQNKEIDVNDEIEI